MARRARVRRGAPAGRPRLVILVGLPGAGKSTLARALQRRRGWAVVDRDAIRAAMFPQCSFTDAEKRAANAAVRAAAAALLRLGRSCVIDGMTFARASERRQARELARRCAARFLAVFLDCPTRVAVARVAAAAGHPAADRTPALVRATARRLEPVDRATLVLDATLPPARLVRQLAAALDAA